MARTVGFYVELLGFAKPYQFPADGEPAYVGLMRDEAELGVVHESSPRVAFVSDPEGNPVTLASSNADAKS